MRLLDVAASKAEADVGRELLGAESAVLDFGRDFEKVSFARELAFVTSKMLALQQAGHSGQVRM